jgi:hypothetical protein
MEHSTTPSPNGLLGLVTLLSVAVIVAPLEAQARRRVTRPPGELIAAFVQDNAAPGRTPSVAGMEVDAVLLDRADYPSANVNAVLDGLESVALTGASGDLRARAALAISASGSRRALHPRPRTVARLERMHQRTDDWEVRAAIVTGLAHSVERQEALRFLEGIAVREHGDYPGSALAALASIAAHEAQGSTVLKRLHITGAVQDPEARQWLELIASCGYGIR